MRRAGGARFPPQHNNNGVHLLLRRESPVHTRSPSPLSPVHCAIATVFVALPKALVKLGFAL
jgi:hypothetical protein